MLVQDVMHTPALTIQADRPLAKAYALMREHGVRHLPVLQADRLVGIVTDRDLRYATSALHPHPFDAEAQVEEVMTREPLTATPLDPVEEAARMMHEHRIGCLPVVVDGQLTGIITVTDLLAAILRLTGLIRPGGRLAVDLDDEPGRLADLTGRLAERGVNIRSVLSYVQEEGRLRVIFRVETLNVRALADQLRKDEFDVIWPPEKPW